MKFKVGDKFAKGRGSGFVGTSLPYCLIPDVAENQTAQPCLLCADLDCVEWAVCYVLNGDGTPIGTLYRVSECQMHPTDQ